MQSVIEPLIKEYFESGDTGDLMVCGMTDIRQVQGESILKMLITNT